MTGEVLRLVSEAQRELLYAARHLGGLCASCGRTLDDGEPVYIEHSRSLSRSLVVAPVGVECATTTFLEAVQGQEPEHCEGCDRPMFYRTLRSWRERARCSRVCRSRVQVMQRRATEGEAT